MPYTVDKTKSTATGMKEDRRAKDLASRQQIAKAIQEAEADYKNAKASGASNVELMDKWDSLRNLYADYEVVARQKYPSTIREDRVWERQDMEDRHKVGVQLGLVHTKLASQINTALQGLQKGKKSVNTIGEALVNMVHRDKEGNPYKDKAGNLVINTFQGLRALKASIQAIDDSVVTAGEMGAGMDESIVGKLTKGLNAIIAGTPLTEKNYADLWGAYKGTVATFNTSLDKIAGGAEGLTRARIKLFAKNFNVDEEDTIALMNEAFRSQINMFRPLEIVREKNSNRWLQGGNVVKGIVDMGDSDIGLEPYPDTPTMGEDTHKRVLEFLGGEKKPIEQKKVKETKPLPAQGGPPPTGKMK
jgi:hypothetical protein